MDADQFTTVMAKLEELHGDFREHKGKTEADIKSATGDIASIKKDMRYAAWWENGKVLVGMLIAGFGGHHYGGKG